MAFSKVPIEIIELMQLHPKDTEALHNVASKYKKVPETWCGLSSMDNVKSMCKNLVLGETATETQATLLCMLQNQDKTEFAEKSNITFTQNESIDPEWGNTCKQKWFACSLEHITTAKCINLNPLGIKALAQVIPFMNLRSLDLSKNDLVEAIRNNEFDELALAIRDNKTLTYFNLNGNGLTFHILLLFVKAIVDSLSHEPRKFVCDMRNNFILNDEGNDEGNRLNNVASVQPSFTLLLFESDIDEID